MQLCMFLLGGGGAWGVSGDPVPWLCREWCWDRATWVYVGLRGRYITVQSVCKHPRWVGRKTGRWVGT